jgi:hypothetical protein
MTRGTHEYRANDDEQEVLREAMCDDANSNTRSNDECYSNTHEGANQEVLREPDQTRTNGASNVNTHKTNGERGNTLMNTEAILTRPNNECYSEAQMNTGTMKMTTMNVRCVGHKEVPNA